MIHSTLNLKKKIKTEPTENYIINSIHHTIKPHNINTDMALAYHTLHQINYNPQINIKYSHIKIALAIQSIFNLTSKFRSTKILSYKLILFQNLSNYQTKLIMKKYDIIIDNQLQIFQGLNKLQQYTVLIQKTFLLNLNHQLLIKKRIGQLFNRISKQIYFHKIIALIQILQYSQQGKNFLENIQYYYNNSIIQNKEIMAIKFASTTLIIKSINNKRLQYQSIFFIKLTEPDKLQQFSIRDISINQGNSNKTGGFEIVENNLNAICLLNQVIKTILKKYFLLLKLQNLENISKRQSLKSSIFNSQSILLKKLIKSGESIMELYQSTNDTEQSKKDQDHDDIVLKRKKMMHQSDHSEPFIKKRISIIQQSQKLQPAQQQLFELKTITKSKTKSKLLWFNLIILILGAILIFRIFQQRLIYI
ncbi:unnamed protein product [Paramecium sonneborni]|uniref:Transmembrane protein n=1 Tax=Paramecium sonneborni TaxID=65129 RepID=A0A8S1PII5_9CILI|nr:unnamed protein product [Paramecium sonneborni]